MNDNYSNKNNWEYDEQSYNALKHNYFEADYSSNINKNAKKGLEILFISSVVSIIASLFSELPIFGILGKIAALIATVFLYVGYYKVGKDIRGCMRSFVLRIVQIGIVIFTLLLLGDVGVQEKTYYGYDRIADSPTRGYTEIIFFILIIYAINVAAELLFWLPLAKELKKNNKEASICYVVLAILIVSFVVGILLYYIFGSGADIITSIIDFLFEIPVVYAFYKCADKF